MKKLRQWWCVCASLILSVSFSAPVYGHGDSGGRTNDLISRPLVANPSVPEFAGARGKVLVNLSRGVVQLRDMEGFPFNVERNHILPVNVTSVTDPRFKGPEGDLSETTCSPQSAHTHSEEEPGEEEHPEEPELTGPWVCHVHSYVVWLAEWEEGALGHAIPLATIYPRRDGTAADRDFSFREGDISGFGITAVLITAEVTFGAMASIAHGHNGEVATQIVPRGPVVLHATLP